MRFPLLLILAVLFTARPDRLSAQEFTPGTVVRIRQPDSSSGIGRIHGISAESLRVRSSVSEQLQPVLRTPVTRLEARRQVSRATRAWTWAKRGFVLGALAGARSVWRIGRTARPRPGVAAPAKDFSAPASSSVVRGRCTERQAERCFQGIAGNQLPPAAAAVTPHPQGRQLRRAANEAPPEYGAPT